MTLLFGKALPKEFRKKIEEKAFTEEDLYKFWESLKEETSSAKESFFIDAAILLVGFGFLVYSLSNGFKENVLEGIIIMGISYLVCLLIFYLSLFKMRKNQFLKSVKKGYPELIDKFK